MKWEYPKKKKFIISNGKRFAIIKKRYKKIYQYPLKKTPLFYLLDKKNILEIIKNYEPTFINSDIIVYEMMDNNSNKVNIFFDKNSLDIAGWKTIDAYSNEVNFLITKSLLFLSLSKSIFGSPKVIPCPFK